MSNKTRFGLITGAALASALVLAVLAASSAFSDSTDQCPRVADQPRTGCAPPSGGTDVIIWSRYAEVSAMTEGQIDELTSYGVDGYSFQLSYVPGLGGSEAKFASTLSGAQTFANNHPELKIYLSTRIRQHTVGAPMPLGSDSAWSTFATQVGRMSDAAETSAIYGIGFDGEQAGPTPSLWENSQHSPLSAAQAEAKAVERGQQIEAAIDNSVPIIQYYLHTEGSWNDNVQCQVNDDCGGIFGNNLGNEWAEGLSSDGHEFTYIDSIFYKSPHTNVPCIYASPCSTDAAKWENAMRQNADGWDDLGLPANAYVTPFIQLSNGPNATSRCNGGPPPPAFDAARAPAQFLTQATQANTWAQNDLVAVYHQGPFFPANCDFEWSDYESGLLAASD